MSPPGARTAPEEERTRLWRNMEERYLESAIHRALGLSLRVLGPGSVAVDFDGAEGARNLGLVPAGGALAEMVDSAVVQACRTLLDPQDVTVTVELKVNFLRPGPRTGGLTTHGEVEQLGNTMAVGQGRVTDAAGKLIALGLVTVAIRREVSA